MFYHISREKGLTELEPRVSTHKEAWVYALTDPAIGLIFAGRDNFGYKADDSFTCFGTTKDNIPEVYELYEGCLEEILKNKDAYIYELEDSGFMENKTSWSPEWVSPNKTKIVGFKYIKDLLTEIKKLEKNGKYIIHYYKNTASYNSFVEGRILKYLSQCCKSGWLNISLIKHYKDIVKKFIDATIKDNFMDGFENLSHEQLQEFFNKLHAAKDNGIYVRKELLYFYPNEIIDWINKRYESVNKATKEK